MPKPAFPPVFSAAQAVFVGLISVIGELVAGTIDLPFAVIRAFPNPVAMADVVTQWMTRTVGVALAAPLRGYGELFAQAIDKAYGSRLMKPADAMRMIFRIPEESLQAVTFTDESSLLEYLIQAFAMWAYRLFKKIKLLRGLIHGYNEGQFIQACIKAFQGKLKHWRFLFFIAIIVGILAFEIILSAYVFTFGIGWLVWKGDFEKFLLPQDSKRVWSRKGRVVRRNTRVGPDK